MSDQPNATEAIDTSPAEAEDITIDASAEAAAESSVKLVPVTESIRYRKRAQAAEQQLGGLREQMKSMESELAQQRQVIESLERRQKIDAILADADAVDLEVARLLTESAVEAMDEPDVAAAVQELRRMKPYLFRRSATPGAAAMAAKSRQLTSAPASEAADEAAASGDRRDLLRYLRLRRNGRVVTA
ncbi:MAG: hypothetical protein WD768_02335 [Phycisphaeraceae bacterium]